MSHLALLALIINHNYTELEIHLYADVSYNKNLDKLF